MTVQETRDGGRYGDAIATTRRLQGLAVAGWPGRPLARELGVSSSTLYRLQRGGYSVTSTLAQRAEDLCDTIGGRPGPSAAVRLKALALGWAPLSAWDSYSIRDPAARPSHAAAGSTPPAAPPQPEIPPVLPRIPPQPGWEAGGVCGQGHDPDIWFPAPTDAAGVQKAKQLCAGCSSRPDCLGYALEQAIDFGVWGGASEEERLRLRRRLRKSTAV